MAELDGVRAVVTGATSGIGAAMADALLAAGAVVAFASRPGERLERAVAIRRERGLPAEPLPVDVRDPESAEAAAGQAAALLGEVDLAVSRLPVAINGASRRSRRGIMGSP